MIHESRVDHALNRLHGHFGNRVVIRPPARAAELAELEAMAGALPRDLTIFLATCNGLRVHLETEAPDEHVSCIHEIEGMMRAPGSPAALGGLVPLREEADGLCDWLVFRPGPLHGRVIQWAAWSPQVTVLASSFGAYLAAWVDHLTDCFDQNGRPRPDRREASFDAARVHRSDADGAALQQDEAVQAWIRDFVARLPSGADFE